MKMSVQKLASQRISVQRVSASRAALIAVLVACSLLLFAGCTGNTSGTDNDADTLVGTEFVADSSVGTVVLNIVSKVLGVGDTTGFSVEVKNGAGEPVANLRVTCDTERGVAILEPNTGGGTALTDDSGIVSGVFGCELPGSHRVVCRGPVGVNFRSFDTIVCRDPVPDGFAGFGETEGGTLGGGTAINDDAGVGGADVDGLSIESIALFDGGDPNAGETGSLVIDTSQNDCDTTGSDPEPEDFGDATAEINLVNDTNSSVVVVSYRFTVENVNGNTLNSGTISLPQTAISALAEGGGTAKLTVLLAFANGAALGGSSKTFAGPNGVVVPVSLGSRNVRFSVTLRTQDGDTVTLRRSIGALFASVNRCD